MTITVLPVNDTPIAGDASFDTHWGVGFSETLQYLASDVDYDELTFALHEQGSGTVSVNPNGTFSYVPGQGFSGTDAFTYRVTDASGVTSFGRVTVGVSNNQPLPTEDVYVVRNGNPLHVDSAHGLLANDYDPGDTLTVVSVGAPRSGTVTWSADGSFTYTPASGAVGDDEFTYVVTDRAGATSEGRVMVYFEQDNRPPVALDYALTVGQGDDLVFNPLEDVYDPDGDAVLLSDVGEPGHGFTQAITGGAIAYVPDSTFTGTDSFTYEVFDGYHYVTATVTVTVTPAVPFEAFDVTV
jgi:hypothetical protein